VWASRWLWAMIESEEPAGKKSAFEQRQTEGDK